MKLLLSSSAQRVQAALAGHGIGLQVVEMPASTRSATEAAAAVGCDVAQIAKSLIFRSKQSDRPVLVVVCGVNRVDEGKVAALIGEAIGKADADFVRARTGFAIGGVPPIGHTEALTTLIDADLLAFDAIWAAAGTPNAVFRLHPSELLAITGGQVADVKSEE
ncbi:MAG: YbaK/EbsC family protein [Chloroflexi bacterium]|nr:MAG: YbaK/EbsC family protein [Chloroflexota bacterium]